MVDDNLESILKINSLFDGIKNKIVRSIHNIHSDIALFNLIAGEFNGTHYGFSVEEIHLKKDLDHLRENLVFRVTESSNSWKNKIELFNTDRRSLWEDSLYYAITENDDPITYTFADFLDDIIHTTGDTKKISSSKFIKPKLKEFNTIVVAPIKRNGSVKYSIIISTDKPDKYFNNRLKDFTSYISNTLEGIQKLNKRYKGLEKDMQIKNTEFVTQITALLNHYVRTALANISASSSTIGEFGSGLKGYTTKLKKLPEIIHEKLNNIKNHLKEGNQDEVNKTLGYFGKVATYITKIPLTGEEIGEQSNRIYGRTQTLTECIHIIGQLSELGLSDLKETDPNLIVERIEKQKRDTNIEWCFDYSSKNIVSVDHAQVLKAINYTIDNAIRSKDEKGNVEVDEISISTSDVYLEQRYQLFSSVIPEGRYTKISITDDNKNQEKDMDKLFKVTCTDSLENDLGMNLITVNQIVINNGGYLNVIKSHNSSPTTTIEMYFPAIDQRISQIDIAKKSTTYNMVEREYHLEKTIETQMSLLNHLHKN